MFYKDSSVAWFRLWMDATIICSPWVLYETAHARFLHVGIVLWGQKFIPVTENTIYYLWLKSTHDRKCLTLLYYITASKKKNPYCFLLFSGYLCPCHCALLYWPNSIQYTTLQNVYYTQISAVCLCAAVAKHCRVGSKHWHSYDAKHWTGTNAIYVLKYVYETWSAATSAFSDEYGLICSYHFTLC